jgi:hypothetical protein
MWDTTYVRACSCHQYKLPAHLELRSPSLRGRSKQISLGQSEYRSHGNKASTYVMRGRSSRLGPWNVVSTHTLYTVPPSKGNQRERSIEWYGLVVTWVSMHACMQMQLVLRRDHPCRPAAKDGSICLLLSSSIDQGSLRLAQPQPQPRASYSFVNNWKTTAAKLGEFRSLHACISVARARVVS